MKEKVSFKYVAAQVFVIFFLIIFSR